MKASTFIKNANKRIMKRIENQIKEQNKLIIKSLKDKPTTTKGIIAQIKNK